MELKTVSFSDTSHFNWMLLKSPKYSWCREINILLLNSRHSDGTEEMRFRGKGTFYIPQLPTCYIMTLKCVHSLSHTHMRLKFHYYVLCSVVFLFHFIFLYSFKMLIVNPLLLNAECKPTKFISRLIVESWVMTHGLKNYKWS